MILYSYFRSSASYRLRIALALKGLEPQDTQFINLREGQQRTDAYLQQNPQGLVPALGLDGGILLSQSLAIMEYMEEAYPNAPHLLPTELLARARVRSIAQQIACELQPLGNLRVLNYLTKELGQPDAVKLQWVQHWLGLGLGALESQLSSELSTGKFCHGDQPTIADCCLVPQLYAAVRFEHDLAPYPTLRRINDAMLALPQVQSAHPSKQPDAVA